MRRCNYPRKAAPQICDRCRKPLGSDDVRVTHREAGKAVGEVVFCSMECFRLYWRSELDGEVKAEVTRQTNSEKNEIYKCVCPACKRRIRALG